MNGLLNASKENPTLREAIEQSWQENREVLVTVDSHILYGSG